MREPPRVASSVYLVECFAPGSAVSGSVKTAGQVAAACVGLQTGYLGALVVPEDELAYHVFAAGDAEVVLEASRRAGLSVERIVRSVAIFQEPLAVAVQPDRPLAHAPGEIGP
jgi:hypothetical protein